MDHCTYNHYLAVFELENTGMEPALSYLLAFHFFHYFTVCFPPQNEHRTKWTIFYLLVLSRYTLPRGIFFIFVDNSRIFLRSVWWWELRALSHLSLFQRDQGWREWVRGFCGYVFGIEG